MNRILLFAGGLVTFALALFKITMPYLFHWREAIGASATGMWSILFTENLGIALLLLFFAYMSIFRWWELLVTGLGKTVLLSFVVLWVYRAITEMLIFKIGVDGAWWRLILFLALGLFYLIPFARSELKAIKHRAERNRSLSAINRPTGKEIL